MIFFSKSTTLKKLNAGLEYLIAMTLKGTKIKKFGEENLIAVFEKTDSILI